jgi:hypothetical protein
MTCQLRRSNSKGAWHGTQHQPILTTHVGSLPRPEWLLDTLKEKVDCQPYDAEALDRQLTKPSTRSSPDRSSLASTS